MEIKTGISASIIADSLNEFGNRITTFVITFPRIVLAEFNTHRMLSRNSASSRAIPFKKMVEAVETNPFIPLKWMKDHKGMQGNQYIENPEKIKFRTGLWLRARDKAVVSAKALHGDIYGPKLVPEIELDGEGVTKQICNRLLEPWMYHTAIVTATEFENFYALRAEGGAEIHICKLAEEMLYAMNESQPKQLHAGEWHIPYGDQMDLDQLHEVFNPSNPDDLHLMNLEWQLLKLKIATARCAQVSYTVMGEDGKALDYAKLIALHDRLAKAGHWSTFEHCAQAMHRYEYFAYTQTFILKEREFTSYVDNHKSHEFEFIKLARHYGDTEQEYQVTENGWLGNFRGFKQYRKQFPNENKQDSRLFKA